MSKPVREIKIRTKDGKKGVVTALIDLLSTKMIKRPFNPENLITKCLTLSSLIYIQRRRVGDHRLAFEHVNDGNIHNRRAIHKDTVLNPSGQVKAVAA